MLPITTPIDDTDPFNLRRFVQAQEPIYTNVLSELRSGTVLRSSGRSAWEIFGSPDDLKLRSSMILFAALPAADAVFAAVLDKYFEGKPDPRTLAC